MPGAHLSVALWSMAGSEGMSLPRCSGPASSTADNIGMAERVRFLSDPASYGNGGSVDVKETSKSWVFLTPTEVYKLKKPIRNHFQDLTSIEARAANTETEIMLNRRLAPEVYLGAVRLTLTDSGALALNGEGAVVDWLVHMRRLPERRMLDQVLLQGTESQSRIKELLVRLAGQLVDFYANAPSIEVAPDEYVARFEREQVENKRILMDPMFAGELDQYLLQGLLTEFDRALAASRVLIEERALKGKVVEGHGDLRPEHVCLVDPPVVIDCLEFSLTLRTIDPFDEIVFLGLECEAFGAPWIEGVLRNEFDLRGIQEPPERVLLFYRAYRAFLRARQCLAHLLVPPATRACEVDAQGQDLSPDRRALLTLASPRSSTSEPPRCRRRIASANNGAALTISRLVAATFESSRNGGTVSVTKVRVMIGSANAREAFPTKRP